ncbi:MAG TPA: hypothetical protein VKR31_10000, partial [Rhizomicrobium sp.]|nr:hypothetical protein [Rhizomicrobium sp.]
MIRHLAAALIASFASVSALAAPTTETPKLLSSWVQMAPGGVAEARAVVDGKSCPTIEIDRQNVAMRLRAPANASFPDLLCAATLPANAFAAVILGHELPLPRPRANRIVVFGDTGCRIKSLAVQACNDPRQWPFPVVAAAAAKLKPDLV